MSLEAVSAAVQSYLMDNSTVNNGSISDLSNVYEFPAKMTPEGDFYTGEDPGHQAGAVIFMYFSEWDYQKLSMSGTAHGPTRVAYELRLNCYFRSTKRKSQDAGRDNRRFIQSLTDSIYSDNSHDANAPGTIFQWGLSDVPTGGRDIRVKSYYPRALMAKASVMQVYSSVDVRVVEMISA